MNKAVVITGSARGLGFELAKCFYKRKYNVVISDINKSDVDNAVKSLIDDKNNSDIIGITCDITKSNDIVSLISQVKKKFGTIDIWINNAGINQADKLIWELSSDEIKKLIDVDLIGTITASRYAMAEMIKQNSGAIYTVEGHGSNDAIIPGISVYGTAKRGVTYFIKALAKEAEVNKKDIIVGALSPGIMITDFLLNAYRDKKIELSDKNRRVYNILGDYPDVVAKYLVKRIVNNTNNGVRIKWLTNRKAAWRFMTAMFRKRDLINEKRELNKH